MSAVLGIVGKAEVPGRSAPCEHGVTCNKKQGASP